MKKPKLAGISMWIIFIVVFIHSCKKVDVYRMLKISTDTIATISDTTALVFGTIIDAGDGITQHGHCWSTNEIPTISDNLVDNGPSSETGEFTSTLNGLIPGTVYYIRAYASNANETIYGEQKFFSSGKGLPKITIKSISNISKASATCEVDITSDGGETILRKGVVWGTISKPVIGNNDGFTKEEGDSSRFTTQITSVSPESTIYVRAYASNENGVAYSQEQEITLLPPESGDYIWAHNYGKNNVDYGEFIWVDPSGNVYLAGTFKSSVISFGEFSLNNTGEDDVFLAKFDAAGKIIWAKSAKGPGFDYVKGICGDAAGNIYLTGSSYNITFGSTTLTGVSMFFVKFNSSGTVQWAKGYSNTSEAIACDASGNIFMTGYGDAANFTAKKSRRTKAIGLTDIFVARFTPSGAKSWANNIGETTFGTDFYLYADLCIDPNGNVYTAGNFHGDMLVNGIHTLTNSGGADIYIVKYNNAGAYIWSRKGSGIGNDYCTGICSSANGDICLTGNFSGGALTFGTEAAITNSGQADLFVAKYNGAGNSIWAKSFGGSNADYGSGICTDASEYIYVCGSFSSDAINFDSKTLISKGESDILITKYSGSGDIIWAQSAGSLLNDEGKHIAINSDYVYITGSVEGPVIYFDYFQLPYLGLDDVFISKIKQ